MLVISRLSKNESWYKEHKSHTIQKINLFKKEHKANLIHDDFFKEFYNFRYIILFNYYACNCIQFLRYHDD